MVSGKRGKRGFTLTELLIVVAILGVIGMTAPRLYIQIRRFFFLSSTRVELQREARAIMVVVSRRMRQARSSTVVLDQLSSQPYYSRISFTDIDGNYIRFYQSGKTLYMVDTSTRTLSKNLRYAAFAVPVSDELGIVSVSFTLEKSIFEGRTKALHMASEKVRLMN